jgi:hypothetical protein
VGLWYPIGVATLCLIIGALYIPSAPVTTELEG